MNHLDLVIIDRYADGLLTSLEADQVATHVARCTSCSKLLSALRDAAPASTTAGASPTRSLTALQPATDIDESLLPPGTLIDRYVVLYTIAAGGMGVVYAAYDPQLDRKVALKLLRHLPARDGALAQARLLREAQAVARLSHPNVVSVYDAGKHSDRVFVALELVEGQHLRAWLHERSRPWRAVLQVALAAGRGLAAAHAAGLVHRDFKPENVLVGADGRARVADFGLVGPAREPEASSRPQELARPAATEFLTQAGAVMGTPGYMAPEQVRGQGSDARTDQFAFAVTLIEALTGERPRANAAPHAPRGVPAAVMRALSRGLLEDRARRFASMDALLTALERAAAARTRRSMAMAVAVVAAVSLIAGGLRLRNQTSLCHGGDDRFATAWNPARAKAVELAFLSTNSPLAADSSVAVGRLMDDYRRGWTTAYADACEATHMRREQPEHVLGLRMACLDRRRREVEALSSLFAHADRDMVHRAAQATSALSPVAACDDVERLMAQIKLPDDAVLHRDADRIHGELVEVKELLDVARYADGETRAARLVDRAVALGYAPLLAEALALRGESLDRAGRPLQAAHVLAQAEMEAQVARNDALAVEISARLGKLLIRTTEYTAGLFWIEHGEALLARSGASPLMEAQLLEARAGFLAIQGKYDQGIPLLRQALSRKEQVLGPDHLALTETLSSLSQMLWPFPELPVALGYAERARAIVEKAHGSDHPEVAWLLRRVGAIYRLMNRHDDERDQAKHALEIYYKVLGPDHPDVAGARWDLATALEFLGDLRGALDQYLQALPVLERAYGPENLRVGEVIGSIATLQAALGDAAGAINGCQRTIAIERKALPESSPKQFPGWLCLGDALTAKGRWDDAASAYAKAEQLTLLGERPELELPPILDSQARLAVRRGRPADALPVLDRASKMLLQPSYRDETPRLASEMVLRARALDALGRSNEAAAEVQRALRILEASSAPNRIDLDQARDLMAALRRKRATR